MMRSDPVSSPSTDVSDAATALIDAFCDQLWLRDGLAAASLASYRRDLTAWSDWLAPRRKDLLSADRGDLEGWLADQFAGNFSPKLRVFSHCRTPPARCGCGR